MLSRRRWLWVAAFLLTIALSLHPWSGDATPAIDTLLQQSRLRYEAGQLNEAKALLQQAQQQSQAQGDALTQAIALSNLALIESDQGDWQAANQSIATSLQILQAAAKTPAKIAVSAQVLNVQGRLQLAQGKAQAALQTWQKTTTLYQQTQNSTGELQSQLRQAQALQALGLYERAYQEVLLPLQERLRQQPNSSTKAWGLRSLGTAIGIVGNLTEAQKVTQESLAIAERLKDAQETAASQLALANLLATRIRENSNTGNLKKLEREQLQRDITNAITLYEQAAVLPSPNRLRAELNHLALLTHLALLIKSAETGSQMDANPLITFLKQMITSRQALITSLQPTLLTLPPDRPSIEARLNFANSLLRLPANKETLANTTLPLLGKAVDQASTLHDSHLLANALGNLGRAQEQSQQLAVAQKTTAQALLTAKSGNAIAQIYRWSAQLGRLQEQQGNRQGAIASYTQAVNALRTLRSNLLGITSETQLLDQETLEPVHRQLVSLLLPDDGSQPSSNTLKQTREVIESLQLEEINNYLRASCLQAQVEIDAVPVPNKTAVIYPLILPKRIAIIVSVTGQETKLYSQPIAHETVEATATILQKRLRNRISLKYQEPSKQLYNWLIKPIETVLQQEKVETLVFVLDGAFRSVPMAALLDGEQFLIEKYSIATTPGLKLTDPKPLQARALSSVAFGLSEASTISLPGGGSQSFSELPFVQAELADLQKQIQPSLVEQNKAFTRNQFKQLLQKSQAPIVHLATHGQFSANRDQTFLVASDGVINIDDMVIALGTGDNTRTTPIELLVLSACETALGDDRAPLGLAGIALKSGARSTVASLWQVNDNATALLMQRFYQAVATRTVTKAEALQQAQQLLLNNQSLRHPYFWAPFVLIGNWL
ncbi:CHAT domain-containing protein [Phormidium sp. FACHB-592]|uniref:CHAT domain-containing protein n=1 Tax=Stenomitos frigidus AS-A4 TaxID=2933935 RepID=A0ABV0KNY6_9CYAN|nr:CHAT domain-containing protein [Phormidium sp. FACHB-592]MBD2072892.1 CHAT domain-containing protein [Phormidium sp. FACHB-592]